MTEESSKKLFVGKFIHKVRNNFSITFITIKRFGAIIYRRNKKSYIYLFGKDGKIYRFTERNKPFNIVNVTNFLEEHKINCYSTTELVYAWWEYADLVRKIK